jgi:L-alanine-DL-glutamate epimerase-like enolase superfamily enzyme
VPFIEFMVPELWPSISRSELVRPEFTPKHGRIELPRTAGLGVELNEDVVSRLTVAAR